MDWKCGLRFEQRGMGVLDEGYKTRGRLVRRHCFGSSVFALFPLLFAPRLLTAHLISSISKMEFQLDAAYFPFAEPNFRYLVSHQHPQEATPASATDPWMAMVLNQWDWNAGPPTDPPIAQPYFVETPQITEVPQTPIPYILPEPQWFHQDWQPVRTLKIRSLNLQADRW